MLARAHWGRDRFLKLLSVFQQSLRRIHLTTRKEKSAGVYMQRVGPGHDMSELPSLIS